MRKSGRPFIPRGATEERQGMAFIHPCFVDDCDASAPFGFGVSLLKGKPGKWACLAHKGLLTAAEHNAPETNPEAPHVESNDNPDGLV